MGYLQKLEPAIFAWLESVRCRDEGWGRWKYSSVMVRPYGLIASIITARIYALYDRLGTLSASAHGEWVSYLQGEQDAADGFFKDRLVGASERVAHAHHSWPDVWGQMNARDALQLLGTEPLYPLPEAPFVDLRRVTLRSELRSWNWERPWHVGERFQRSLEAYCDAGGDAGDAVVTEAFAFVEEEIFSAVDGLPSGGGCRDQNQLCGGAFKLLVAYLKHGRRFPYAEPCLDALLAMQNERGDFAAGGMCMNWDAAWMLWWLDRQLGQGHRHADVKAALLRLAGLLMGRYRKGDGAFSFCEDVCLGAHHSIFLGPTCPVSDMLGTLMALYSLAYADEVCGEADFSLHPFRSILIFLR